MISGGLLVLAAFAGLSGSMAGCVETAECNAAVPCPEGDVCYEYRCRTRCETAAECAENEICAPCQTITGTHDQGQCFGEDLNACVEGES